MTLEILKSILEKIHGYKNDENPSDLFCRFQNLESYVINIIEKNYQNNAIGK